MNTPKLRHGCSGNGVCFSITVRSSGRYTVFIDRRFSLLIFLVFHITSFIYLSVLLAGLLKSSSDLLTDISEMEIPFHKCQKMVGKVLH